jgi:maleylacetoacetate isomerase
MIKTPEFTLYHYWRSSSSWRVRFALEVKKIPYEKVAVGLLNGESESAEHLARSPAGFVPVLKVSNGEYLQESLSIIRYLEELYPEPKLLSGTALDRARIWTLAEVVNSGTHPLQNLPVLARVSEDKEVQKTWAQHFIRSGLQVYETMCAKGAGRYSHGDDLSVADLCLIPQLYNADRYGVDYSDLKNILRIQGNVHGLDAYTASHPDRFVPPDFKP